MRGITFRLARTLRWMAMAGALPLLGCGGEGTDSGQAGDGEDLALTEQSLETPVLSARLFRKASNATRYRGDDADYIMCTGQPFDQRYTFSNRGRATWRDVDGRGTKHGSDVKLVTASGKRDFLSQKKYLSVDYNLNNYVRADRDAAWCATEPGCRRTQFNTGGLWAVAPQTPGTYGSRWRMRDYSAAADGVSDPFGPKVGLRFKVVDCALNCGCIATCSDGQTKEVPAGESNCQEVAAEFCYPAEYVSSQWIACPSSGSGGTSGSSGSTGSGGSAGSWPLPSSGGTGGTSGSGAGGSGSGGTSNGGFSCGGQACEIPSELEGQAEPCCAGTACGITTAYSTGQCVPLYSPSADEQDPNAYAGNEDEDDPNNNDTTPDDAGFVDPEEAIESDGVSLSSSEGAKGCSIGALRPRASGLAAIAVFLVGFLACRRRGA